MLTEMFLLVAMVLLSFFVWSTDKYCHGYTVLTRFHYVTQNSTKSVNFGFCAKLTVF